MKRFGNIRSSKYALAGLVSLSLACLFPATASTRIASVEVASAVDVNRVDQPVNLDLQGLGIPQQEWNIPGIGVIAAGIPLPSQTVDSDGDGVIDSLLVITDLAAGERQQWEVVRMDSSVDVPVPAKRTQADLGVKHGGIWVKGKNEGNRDRGDYKYSGGEFRNVISWIAPAEHSDHSDLVRYEGVGIESDKVGYRIYLDWRNGFDIFGKTTHHMVLKDIGLDGFESYHSMQPWGMDLLKVGDAVGVGGFGYWDGTRLIRVSDTESLTCQLTENGHLQSSIHIRYGDWKPEKSQVHLDASLAMQAGSRSVDVHLKVSDDLPNMAAGIVKHPGVTVLKGDLDITGEAWSYVATWGKQSLDGGNLGMAILFQKNQLSSIAEDEHNHVVVLRSNDRRYHYRFLAAWDGEKDAVRTLDEFKEYLDEEVLVLTRSPRVRKTTAHAESQWTIPVTAEDALEWSRRLAQSQLDIWGDHLVYGSFDQDQRIRARWGYTTGLMALAYDELGKAAGFPHFQEQAHRIISSFIDEEGGIHGYRFDAFNIDEINSGKMVLRMYEETKEPRYRKAADLLRQQLREHPRTSEGGFWHKKIYPYQLWLDGVYMGMPFLAHWELLFNEARGMDEAIHEFELVRKHCHDPVTGLYYHAWDEKKEQPWANPSTGLSQHFWGRGLGWYCMALVDMLDLIPAEQKQYRETIVALLEEVAFALVKHQDDESGCWYQILDKPEAVGNYLESSASSMFVYTLAKAIDRGYLDADRFLAPAIRGYEGMIREFLEIDAENRVRLTHTCRVAGLGYGRDGSYHYYMSEPVVRDDPKGVGPFILAGIEVSKALEKRPPIQIP